MTPFKTSKLVAKDVPGDQYQAFGKEYERGSPDYVMSRSDLMEFAFCPSRWKRGYTREDTKATEWGSLIDAMVLLPAKLEDLVAVCPEDYPDSKTQQLKPWNRNATFCREWEAEREGKLIVKAPVKHEANHALARLLGDAAIQEIISNSDKSVFLLSTYEDRETGLSVQVKSLLDIVPHKSAVHGSSLADFKTGRSADPSAWSRAVFDRQYHVQGRLYLDAYNAACPDDTRGTFLHVVQENFLPYETALFQISEEFLEMGRVYVQALKLYCQCLQSGQWPSYTGRADLVYNGVAIVQPQPWMVGILDHASLYVTQEPRQTPYSPEEFIS